MAAVLWILTILGALLGGAWFLLGSTLTESAPQAASVAAQALCWAVIPYVIARAVTEIAAENRRKRAEREAEGD